jgi:hypothetical protein
VDDTEYSDVDREIFAAADRLKRHGDNTLKRLLLEVEGEDETETVILRAQLVNALLPGDSNE